MNTDHVVMKLAVPAPVDAKVLPLACERCGTTLYLVLPVDLNTLAGVADVFTKAHRDCEKLKD